MIDPLICSRSPYGFTEHTNPDAIVAKCARCRHPIWVYLDVIERADTDDRELVCYDCYVTDRSR